MSNLEWLREAVLQDTEECVEWPFYKFKGYGQIRIAQRTRMVSGVVLELSGRPWHPPLGLSALHSCDNPACVNPRHLSWGTPRRNIEEAQERGRLSEGDRHASKLTAVQVAEILVLSREGWTQEAIGRRFGVHQTQVGRILRNVDWKSVPRD